MKLPSLLIVCLFGITSVSGLFKSLFILPKYQHIFEYENVVIDCFEKEGGEIHWSRPRGLPLPENARQEKGRLIIEKIKYVDAGLYTCYSKDKKFSEDARVEVLLRRNNSSPLRVLPKFQTTFESSTNYPFSTETYGLRSTENPFKITEVPKKSVNVPYSCLYGICNGTCCESNSIQTFFDCANGQKINKSLVCNRVNDCEDGSDESKCAPWPSKITVLPKHKVEVYCGDQDKEKTGTLVLECESVGHPTPVVRWKKYDGHVPTKCQQFSKRGHGILTCPDFQQSDQGAYSCVAENSEKSAESQPKSLAKCSNTIHCSNGFKVVSDEQIEHCIECYCSSRTTKCQNIKSNPTVIKIPFPENPTEIFAKDNGEILFLPTKTELTPNSKIRNTTQEIAYCSLALSESDLQETSFVKSFGRNIIIPRYKGKTSFMEKAPDLIIRGNGLSLMYTANLLTPPKGNVMDMTVKFWPGNWHHLNKSAANRKDLMKVLSNVDSLFIRCEYQQGNVLSFSTNTTIVIESSTIKDFPNSVSYVEKCNCPSGYDGLSCETCAAGYERKSRGNDFTCEKIYIPPPVVCKEGYINPPNCSLCDTSNGYHRKGNVCLKATCHPIGSTSLFPDIFHKCTCRERVTGNSCDRCENDSFYLHKDRGCLKCWCSGITNQCNSSNLFRTVISNTPRGGYNSSDGRNFWLLPSDFSGNRLTSYGGHLNYTMKYKPLIPKENTHLTVELLSMADITLIYTHSTVDNSLFKDEKSWVVPLTEVDWKKSDKSPVTRGEFLTVLSNIKAIYIESPYHLSSGQANLTSTRMSSASGDGENGLALAVERCNCPRGYTGLSCEKCSEGYYKKRNGTITQCIKCNCTYCDPDFGCPDCPQLTYRDNPEEEKIPVCKSCPCNGNGISCVKDDYNQVFCRCKPGFTGMHCENLIPKKRNDLTITISPRRISGKKVGTSVFLNCSVFSNEELTLTAKKTYLKPSVYNDSKILSSQGSRISEHFEVILEVGLEAVECIVHDIRGRVAGRVVSVIEDLITVLEPVKITNCYSEKIYVKESESKEIICQATGSPTPMVNWYKMANGSESEKVDTEKGVHTIESASLKDNGTIYTCIAENLEGDKATCAQVLIVRKKCEVINIFPKHVRAIEGEDISILCKTTAKSPVVWSALDTFFGREKAIVSARAKVQNGYLRFKNTTVGDSGTYICSAMGEDGKINQTIVVVVEGRKIPPTVSILEFDKTLKVGESFTVTCIVTGKPTPFVTWTKLNGTLDSGNVFAVGKTLHIKKATLSNSGIYTCEAQSIAGVASGYISIKVEQVLVPPRINVSEKSIKAYEGDVVRLSCLTIGYPRPKLRWIASGVNFTTISRENDKMVLIEPNESVKEEVSFKVTKEMDGLIINCMTDNSAGRDEAAITIKVLQSKGGINETLELVPIGSYFELQCDFPGELKWEKVGGQLFGDECPIPNALMIQSVQVQHNGTYLCKDEDSDSKKIINLKVVGFVPKFSKPFKSFLVLPNKLNSSSETRIELSFNATHGNGVLLQTESSKLDIYLEERKIHLNIHFIEGDLLDIEMNKPIHLESWYSLIVSITKNYVDITIYDEMSSIHERKTKRFTDLETGMSFDGENFILGKAVPRPRHRQRMLLRGFSYFDGCISRLSINRHEFDIVREASYSQNVTLCGRCTEPRSPCGIGKCLDAPTQRGFVCVCPNDAKSKSHACPASCSGKGCETQLDLCTLLNPCNGFIHKCVNKLNSLQCDCAYGYAGDTCERVREYSFCTSGNGYVKLQSSLLKRQIGVPEIIRMGFTLHTSSGQLLWQGDRANHLSIAVRDGILEYVYLNQYMKLELRKGGPLSLDRKYGLLSRRINGTVIMELTWSPEGSDNGRQEVYRNASLQFYTNRVMGDIYLGNVPNSTRHFGHVGGLNGCIHYVSFGDEAKINFSEKEVEKFNVLPQKLYQDLSDSSSYESDYNDGNSDFNEIQM